jgi:hypothetical protein
LAAAKKEFQQLEEVGIIHRLDSHLGIAASPLHMVRKVDGSWQTCGDYRLLNVQMTPDRYTCPHIGDLTARLKGCSIFTKLDLRQGYHQVPVHSEDIEKTPLASTSMRGWRLASPMLARLPAANG